VAQLQYESKKIRLRSGAALTGVAAAFLAIMFWSTNALAAKFALAELGVVQVLALQFGGATATLATLRALRSARARRWAKLCKGPRCVRRMLWALWSLE